MVFLFPFVSDIYVNIYTKKKTEYFVAGDGFAPDRFWNFSAIYMNYHHSKLKKRI